MDHKEQIAEKALEHEDGYYLLSHSSVWDKDATFKCCEELVTVGRAEWLPSFNNKAPGIRVFR